MIPMDCCRGLGHRYSGPTAGVAYAVYIAFAMLIWAVPIPADRWHWSLWP